MSGMEGGLLGGWSEWCGTVGVVMNVEWRRENEGRVSRDGCPDSRACV